MFFCYRISKFFLVFLENALESTLLQNWEFIFKFPQSTDCSIFYNIFSNVVSFSRRNRLITASSRFRIGCVYSCFIAKHVKTSLTLTRKQFDLLKQKKIQQPNQLEGALLSFLFLSLASYYLGNTRKNWHFCYLVYLLPLNFNFMSIPI